ncbi:MAG: hypothetical protein JWO08_4383 [Verrucomicrobiaceae bacterium]|nr:hypothetical protein [Verrucomicrobiaceae bacterium]
MKALGRLHQPLQTHLRPRHTSNCGAARDEEKGQGDEKKTIAHTPPVSTCETRPYRTTGRGEAVPASYTTASPPPPAEGGLSLVRRPILFQGHLLAREACICHAGRLVRIAPGHTGRYQVVHVSHGHLL